MGDNSIKAGEAFLKQWEKLPAEEREAFEKSIATRSAAFGTALRILSDVDKSFEPARKAMYAILRQPKPSLFDNNLADLQSQHDGDKSLDTEFTPSQADSIVTALSVGLAQLSKSLVDASERSDDIAIKSLAVSVEANWLARWAMIAVGVSALVAVVSLFFSLWR